MLKPAINMTNNVNSFAKSSAQKDQASEESRILPNSLKTRVNQAAQKTTSAFIDYPIRGLKGDVNSNFYEFLTMGIVPYLAGSAAFMFVFNAANKHLNLFEKEKASVYGKKMALGVVLYGLFKTISKNLVTKPIKNATGVDTEMPYENVVYSLPTEAGANANIDIQHQQRKIYDSKEFFRKDLLTKEYFDNVAVKLGLGENLNDSVSEVTPIIQNIVATTNTAKSLSSYCWAGVGVGLAVQDSWKDFFNTISGRNKFIPDKEKGFLKNRFAKWKNSAKNLFKISASFVKSLINAFVQMWKGKANSSGITKQAGKIFISTSALLTGLLTWNTVLRAKKMAGNSNKMTIDKAKESMVI